MTDIDYAVAVKAFKKANKRPTIMDAGDLAKQLGYTDSYAFAELAVFELEVFGKMGPDHHDVESAWIEAEEYFNRVKGNW